MSEFMAAQARSVLDGVAKLGKETREAQDEQDANLREVTYKVADRYLWRFGGSLAGWYGTDLHYRVINRHGEVIAKCKG